MSFHKRSKVTLPEWLWFFLLLPMVLIVALLYRRGRMPRIAHLPRLPRIQPTGLSGRYVEPDSIPLNMSITENIPVAARMESVVRSEPEVVRSEPEVVRSEPARQEVALQEVALDDDLKIIEGIGPAIARILHENGIRTLRQLAKTPTLQLVEILTQANLNRLADPTTWPEQAQLAADGKWDDLAALQGTLKAGRKKAK